MEEKMLVTITVDKFEELMAKGVRFDLVRDAALTQLKKERYNRDFTSLCAILEINPDDIVKE